MLQVVIAGLAWCLVANGSIVNLNAETKAAQIKHKYCINGKKGKM